LFYDLQPTVLQDDYLHLLKIVGALSKLSSDSDIPYLYYRMAENIFCKSFDATNLARSDISIDASKGEYGIGLKTFLYKNGCCVEKIAEFNKQRRLFAGNEQSDLQSLIKTVAELRNERILTSVDITGVDKNKLLYHCVVRDTERFVLYETPMDIVDIAHISNIKKSTDNTIYFDDHKNEYCFNISKSTLFKKFYVHTLKDFEVHIFDDPYEELAKIFGTDYTPSHLLTNVSPIVAKSEHIILPLYSTRGKIKSVPEGSGLNQWNAKGRPRDADEVYIPIPAWIHRAYPCFFPDRDTPFTLVLPNKKTLSAKVCQDGGKALMTNPNKDLGKWLLRQVLKLKEGELLTYEMLEKKNIDSIEISKDIKGNFYINFKSLDAYEKFANENNEK
jgi:hypothetical protein